MTIPPSAGRMGHAIGRTTRAESAGEGGGPEHAQDGRGRFGVGREEGRDNRAEPTGQRDQHESPDLDGRLPIAAGAETPLALIRQDGQKPFDRDLTGWAPVRGHRFWFDWCTVRKRVRCKRDP